MEPALGQRVVCVLGNEVCGVARMCSVMYFVYSRDADLTLWRLPTRVYPRSKPYRCLPFGVNAVLETEGRLSFEGESFLWVSALEEFWFILVWSSSPRRSALSAFLSVLACKVSYDPS